MIVQQNKEIKYKLSVPYIVTTWKFLGIPVYTKSVRSSIVT